MASAIPSKLRASARSDWGKGEGTDPNLHHQLKQWPISCQDPSMSKVTDMAWMDGCEVTVGKDTSLKARAAQVNRDFQSQVDGRNANYLAIMHETSEIYFYHVHNK